MPRIRRRYGRPGGCRGPAFRRRAVRPLVIDAARVREIHPAAAEMLLSLLRAKREAGTAARIIAATPALRRRWAAHPLARFFAVGEAAHAGESLLICPDREEVGFSPSAR